MDDFVSVFEESHDVKCDVNPCRVSLSAKSTIASSSVVDASLDTENQTSYSDDDSLSYFNVDSPRSVDSCHICSNELIEAESVEECCVCLDASADSACSLPCGHLCLCSLCAQKLAATPGRNRCPYCRASFQMGDAGRYVSAPDTSSLYDGTLYRELRSSFLEQRTQWQMNEPVRCPCGDVMVKVQARAAYYVTSGCPVECDICRRIIRGSNTVYHCPHELGFHHPFGFDLCQTCAHGGESRAKSCLFATWNGIRQWFRRFLVHSASSEFSRS